MEVLTPPLFHQSASIVVTDDTGVGAARRAAVALSAAAGLDATRSGKLALVVTEAASNALHHAGGGEVLLRRLRDESAEGVEMLAIDRGPGMRNVAQCMVDGYSTRGTSGAGLGSIARNSDVFDVFSASDRGTVLLSQTWSAAQPAKRTGPRWGAVCVPIQGERVSGDGYAVSVSSAKTTLALFDGLGHGQGAADATLVALQSFQAHAARGLIEIVEPVHAALRPTRGAAGAFIAIDLGAQELRFAGIGNCSASIHAPSGARPIGLASQNGTLGVQMPRVNELRYAWPADGLLIMHSDGLATRWNLDDYSGLMRRHPSVTAAVLYRDFSRNRDDVTVLVFTSASA